MPDGPLPEPRRFRRADKHRQVPDECDTQSLGFLGDRKIDVAPERVANLDEIDAPRLQFVNRSFRGARVANGTHQGRQANGKGACRMGPATTIRGPAMLPSDVSCLSRSTSSTG